MKICVVGAGAIGGYLAVRLAGVGHDVSVIVRGPHLAAIRANGLKLIKADGGAEQVATNLVATDRIADLEAQDIVLLALKAHQIEAVVDDLPRLFGSETVMITLQNGIPWWYFQKLGGEYANQVVRTVDPNGELLERIDPDRLVGCIAYPAATVAEPGIIKHIEGDRFPVGELDGTETARVPHGLEGSDRCGVQVANPR